MGWVDLRQWVVAWSEWLGGSGAIGTGPRSIVTGAPCQSVQRFFSSAVMRFSSFMTVALKLLSLLAIVLAELTAS
jgi:hypothetical protein